jgi:hypothetical protein
MADYVMVHDRRVIAGIPARPNLGIVHTDQYTRVQTILQRVNAYARWGRIRALYILAHGKAGFNAKPRSDGFSSYEGPGAQCMDAGGMGVSLGAEGIRQHNVNAWIGIRGRVDNIVVYACGAADTQPGNEFTLADGRYLMGALALATGAFVYAGTGIQWRARYRNLPNGRFILEGWRGQLLCFDPDTGVSKQVLEKELEFDFNRIMRRPRR